MATQLEELKKKVDDAVKRQKSGEIDLTILEVMLKNKKAVLIELEEAVKEQKEKLKSLEKDYAESHAKLESDISHRNEESKTRESKAKVELEQASREHGTAETERQNLQNKQVNLDATTEKYKSLSEKVASKIKELQELL